MIEHLYAQVIPYSTDFKPVYLVFPIMGAIIIAVVAIFNKYNEERERTIARPRGQGGRQPLAPFVKTGKFNQEIKAISSSCKFNHRQTAVLTKVCVDNRLERPYHLIRNARALEEAFSRELTRIESVVPRTREIEEEITLLFTVREALENARKNQATLVSSRSLENGQPFTIVTPDQEQYPVLLFENSPRGLVCKVPRDSFGNELRLQHWSRIEIYFSLDNGQTYRYPARVAGYESGVNESLMIISHTDALKPLPNRRHDRRNFSTDCTFTYVSVANVVNGRKTEHRFYPMGKSYPGAITDISAGGCSIRTPAPPPQNQYIEIECSLDGKSQDSMTGKVLRLSETSSHGDKVAHVQFAKMPRTTMNRVFALIYEHGE